MYSRRLRAAFASRLSLFESLGGQVEAQMSSTQALTSSLTHTGPSRETESKAQQAGKDIADRDGRRGGCARRATAIEREENMFAMVSPGKVITGNCRAVSVHGGWLVRSGKVCTVSPVSAVSPVSTVSPVSAVSSRPSRIFVTCGRIESTGRKHRDRS